MIINLYFDHKYFYWTKPLIDSIKILEPKTKIHLHTYNLSDEQIKELKSYPNVIAIEHAQMEFDSNKSDAYTGGAYVASRECLNKNRPLRFEHNSKGGLLVEDPLRFQITCRKGEYLLKSMSKFPKEDLFLIMDIDMLLIRPLKDLKKQMQNHDVGLIRVGENKVMGGFFIVRSTKAGKQYISSFNKQAMAGRLYFCKDQKTLAKVYNETKKEIKFLLLDRKYSDHTSSKKAFIWSAHKVRAGTKIEKYEKYEKYLKYLKKFPIQNSV